MNKKSFWIWLSGFTDADGSIGIHRAGSHFQPKIQWSNTNKNVLLFIKKNATIKNKLYKKAWRKPFKDRGYNYNQKQQYTLVVSNRKDCLRIAKKLLPFLKIKQKLAQRVIGYITENQSKF